MVWPNLSNSSIFHLSPVLLTLLSLFSISRLALPPSHKSQERKQVDLVLLDFSKAFDKVSHSKFLFKLSQHGVKGNTLN